MDYSVTISLSFTEVLEWIEVNLYPLVNDYNFNRLSKKLKKQHPYIIKITNDAPYEFQIFFKKESDVTFFSLKNTIGEIIK